MKSFKEGINCGQHWSGLNQRALDKVFSSSSSCSSLSDSCFSLTSFISLFFPLLSPYLVHFLTYNKLGSVDFHVKHVFVKAVYFSNTSGVPMAPVGEPLLQREEVFSRSSWPKEVNLYHRFKLLSIFTLYILFILIRSRLSWILDWGKHDYFWIIFEFNEKHLGTPLSNFYFFSTVAFVNVIKVILHVK